MLAGIKDLLSSAVNLTETTSGQAPRDKLLTAIGVLLLEMAGADNDFDPEEVKTCFRSLEEIFEISDSKALKILEASESAREDKENINTLIEELNKNYTEEQRVLIMGLVWKVVVADQKIEKHELRYANQIRVRLQLSEAQNEEARELAFSGKI